jgi:hypothetical protein
LLLPAAPPFAIAGSLSGFQPHYIASLHRVGIALIEIAVHKNQIALTDGGVHVGSGNPDIGELIGMADHADHEGIGKQPDREADHDERGQTAACQTPAGK